MLPDKGEQSTFARENPYFAAVDVLHRSLEAVIGLGFIRLPGYPNAHDESNHARMMSGHPYGSLSPGSSSQTGQRSCLNPMSQNIHSYRLVVMKRCSTRSLADASNSSPIRSATSRTALTTWANSSPP